MGKGTVDIKTRNGFVESISNVFYIPDLKVNLLSIDQVQEKGCMITFQNNECEIYDSRRGSIAKMQNHQLRIFIDVKCRCKKFDGEERRYQLALAF